MCLWKVEGMTIDTLCYTVTFQFVRVLTALMSGLVLIHIWQSAAWLCGTVMCFVSVFRQRGAPWRGLVLTEPSNSRHSPLVQALIEVKAKGAQTKMAPGKWFFILVAILLF